MAEVPVSPAAQRTGYVSKIDQRVPVARTIRSIFNAPDANEANRLLGLAMEGWRKEHPKLAAWAEENLAQGFAVFGFPPGHRVRMRRTNGVEPLNKEIKRRTRVGILFPNSASCLRLVSTIIARQNEEWMTKNLSDHQTLIRRLCATAQNQFAEFTEKNLLYLRSTLHSMLYLANKRSFYQFSSI